MNYKKIYDNLIIKAKNRKNIYEYYEIHHIIPKSIGGTNDKNNLVKLTLREHFVAHKLLINIYPNSKELKYALWMMTISTIKAEERMMNEKKNIRGRLKFFLNKKNKKIISSYEYELLRLSISEIKKQKKYSKSERENVSNGTIRGMRNIEVINKCISGSKGCHYYYDKKTKQVFKWFPGDKDIDLTKYTWGRGAMTDEQRKKISDLKNLKKRYFIIPQLNTKYTMYVDYLNSVPYNWVEKWTNNSNQGLKKIIIKAIRIVNLKTNYNYENELIITDKKRSKNFKIISPSIFEFCFQSMDGWEKYDVSDKIAESIMDNINNIIKNNKIYIKK